MEFSISTLAYDLHGPVEPRLLVFRAAGFTAIDWTEQYATALRYTERDAEDVMAACERHGIRIATMHGATHLAMPVKGSLESRDALWLELIESSIQFLAHVGGDCVALHLPNTSRGDLREHIRSSRRLLDALRPCAERRGVRLALENSPGLPEPGEYWPPNRELIDVLLESYPPEFLGWCFDSGHAHIRHELDILETYADRLIATHLHDNNGLSDQHLLPGQGSIDWQWVISTLKRCGYAGPVNLEVQMPAGQEQAVWCAEAYSRIKDVWERY
jgi:sugar phosphate isomerase/epimerase